ncbi:MAG: glutamate mutase L [Chloroflexota bacterium]
MNALQIPLKSLGSNESLLVIDVGEINTRAVLFDIVDANYRFIASSIAPTTVNPPLQHAGYGVRLAIEYLETNTGRTFIGEDEKLIMPTQEDGRGVDAFAMILSAGVPLNVVVMGVLEEFSVESARRLAESVYSRVSATFHMNDGLKAVERSQEIVRLLPDLILIAGGTEQGAQQPVLQMLKQAAMACSFLPKDVRPIVLYAGNSDLSQKAKEMFAPLTSVKTAPNIRPQADTEKPEAARTQIAQVFRQVRLNQMMGIQTLDTWSGKQLLPSATAFGRIIRFLSMDDPGRGVLGVDVGATNTTIAAAWCGELTIGNYPKMRFDPEETASISDDELKEIMTWVYARVSEDYVLNYIYNKQIYPASLPQTFKDEVIEQALARHALRRAFQKTMQNFRETHQQPGGQNEESKPFSFPPFEPIVAAGSVLTRAPSLAQSALMLLDGIQPTNVTTLILDQNHLAAAMGAAALSNPTLTVQVIDSNAFLNLGMVISPVSSVRSGMPVLRLRMVSDGGMDIKAEVNQGEMRVFPLPADQNATLILKPLNLADIGMGAGNGGRLNKVSGGALGVVIDARGRPLRLPLELSEKRDLYKGWLKALRESR